jgi:hypothetical protein
MNGKYLTYCNPRFSRGLAGTIICLFLVMVCALPEVWGAMYICREKSGAVNFTNVPVSSTCQIFSMDQTGGIRLPMASHSLGKAADPLAYDHEIHRVARRYQVDPSLVKAIIHTESYFDPRAVSSKGALGLMQLMPDTARDLNVAHPFNPLENIDGGTRYIRQLLDSFGGNLTMSLAAYNAGPGLVARTGGIPAIPETRDYVVKVLKHYKEYKRKLNISPLLVRD